MKISEIDTEAVLERLRLFTNSDRNSDGKIDEFSYHLAFHPMCSALECGTDTIYNSLLCCFR